MATAMTMSPQSLQAFTDSYFSPPSSSKAPMSTYYRSSPGLRGFNARNNQSSSSGLACPLPYHPAPVPQNPHRHRQQSQYHAQRPAEPLLYMPANPSTPVVSQSQPLSSSLASSSRSPYTHPTRARSRAISLSASPLQHSNAAVSQTAKQSLPTSSILYTSPYNNNNQSTWKFTPSDYSFASNPNPPVSKGISKQAPSSLPSSIRVSATVTTMTSVSTPTVTSTATSASKVASSTPKLAVPTPSPASYARALALRASRSKVVAGMMLHRIYSQSAPRRRLPPLPSSRRSEYVQSHLSTLAYSYYDDEEEDDDDGADSDNESVFSNSSSSSDSSVLTLVAEEALDEKFKDF